MTAWFLALAFTGLLQDGPVILSSADLEGWYHELPEEIHAAREWMGLFPANPDSAAAGGRLRIAPAQVRAVPDAPLGEMGWRIVSEPANAIMLVSGVPGLAPRLATVVGGATLLWHGTPSTRFLLGTREYTIRLHSIDPTLCDAVIVLSSEEQTQHLFDIRLPDRPGSMGAGLACDDPHFAVHWAGDLDGDGRLDILATFSRKYSYYPNQLWLSSAARSGELMAEVARYEKFSK